MIKITTKDSEIKFEIEFTMFPASVVVQLLVVQCWLIWTTGEGEIIGVNRENNNQTESRNDPWLCNSEAEHDGKQG